MSSPQRAVPPAGVAHMEALEGVLADLKNLWQKLYGRCPSKMLVIQAENIKERMADLPKGAFRVNSREAGGDAWYRAIGCGNHILEIGDHEMGKALEKWGPVEVFVYVEYDVFDRGCEGRLFVARAEDAEKHNPYAQA